MLVRITAPHFCAGCVLEEGKATLCAPILKYMTGWTVAEIRKYVTKKRWVLEIVIGEETV